jgi:predicted secreted protein with PEFG-CTERM motif
LIVFSIVSASYAQESEYKGTPKKLLNVGSEFDGNGNGFEIDYILEGELKDTVKIDPELRSITFGYDSKGIEEDVLIIFLPKSLIDTPIGVYIDDIQETDAIRNQQGNLTRLIIPVFEDSKEIKIVGTRVIPEFNNLVLIILTLTIISTIVISKSKFFQHISNSRY